MLPPIGNATLCVVEVQQLKFFAFFDIPARPSAEIGAVEVQQLKVFYVF